MLDAEIRKHTAYHEAGHAVATLNQSQWEIGPGGIEIDDDQICWSRIPQWDAKSIWHHTVVNCAGRIAERKLTGRPLLDDDEELLDGIGDIRQWGEDGDWASDAGDDYATLTLMLELHPEATDAEILTLYRQHERRTIKLLDEPDQWAAVEKIAAALIEKGKLSAEEVTALYGSAVPQEAVA